MEPWFNPSAYAWIPGAALGCLGAVAGVLCGVLAPRGKAKPLVFGLFVGCIVACAILLVAGVTAYFVGQPYGIWYGLGWPGLLGLCIFPGLLPVMRRTYTAAEIRKLQARDM